MPRMDPGAKEPEPQRGPNVRAQTFWLLLGRLPKVTRRKGGTLLSHHPKNGSAPQKPQNPKLACTKNVRGAPTYIPELLSLERVKYCLSKTFFTPAPSFRFDTCGPKS